MLRLNRKSVRKQLNALTEAAAEWRRRRNYGEMKSSRLAETASRFAPGGMDCPIRRVSNHGRMLIGVPSGTAAQISSISALLTAMHPSVQSWSS